MTLRNSGIADVQDNRSKNVIFKGCTRYINCLSQINNTQVDNDHDVDAVMFVYYLTEYSDTSQFY